MNPIGTIWLPLFPRILFQNAQIHIPLLRLLNQTKCRPNLSSIGSQLLSNRCWLPQITREHTISINVNTCLVCQLWSCQKTCIFKARMIARSRPEKTPSLPVTQILPASDISVTTCSKCDNVVATTCKACSSKSVQNKR